MKSSFKIFAASLGAGVLWCFNTGCISMPDMGKSTNNVKQISQDNFDSEIGSSPKTVVDFYATWCGPCRKLSPMLDTLAASYTNNVKFVKVDIDRSPDVAKKYSVEIYPTVLFLKNGQVADRITGLPEEKDLKSKLDAFSAAN